MIAADAGWRREEPEALVLRVHVQPGAKRTEVAGIHGEGEAARVKLRLAAPPVDGKANDELQRFLALQFGVPRRAVEIVQGDTSRRKTVRIARPARRPDLSWAAG